MRDAVRIAQPQIASDAKKFFFFFFASDAKTHSLDLKSQENARKEVCENPAMLACDAKNRGVGRAMRNACDSASRCGLACDASACDAKSLAMWVERCEPLRASRKAPRQKTSKIVKKCQKYFRLFFDTMRSKMITHTFLLFGN